MTSEPNQPNQPNQPGESAEAKEPVLFISKGKEEIRASDFVRVFRELGIQEGQQIFLHTRMFGFGKLNWRARLSKEQICDSLIGAFKAAVGPKGTVMMTTFTQKAHDTGIYDVDNSPSEGGALTEYFRKLPDVHRSEHPTHSFAIWGKDKEFYLSEAQSTFDMDSAYGKTLERNAWLVDWGTDFKSTTFLHLIEHKAGLPYRKESTQEIQVKAGDKVYTRSVFKYRKSTRLSVDYRAFEKDLLAKGLLKKREVGDGQVLAIQAKVLYEEGLEALKKDKYYFVRIEPFWPYYKRQLKMLVKSWLGK